MNAISLYEESPTDDPLALASLLAKREAQIAALEDECKQMRDLLKEALADSGAREIALAAARHELTKARTRQRLLEDKLALIEAGEGAQGPTVALLRAELEQACRALFKARQTIHDLALFTAGPQALTLEGSARPFAPVLELLEAQLDSIDATLSKTSG